LNNFWLALIAGFVGSILTFAFTRAGIMLTRLRKRNVLNYNALVKLEHLSNVWSGIVNDNRQNLETIISASQKVRVLPLNRLGKIPLYEDIKLKLLDIELINRVFDIETSLRRINDDSDNINYHLNSFQKAILSKNMDPDEYLILLNSLRPQLESLLGFYKSFLDELAELSAFSRIRLSIDRTSSIKLLGYMASVKKRSVSKKELLKEKKKILQEIEKNRQKSIKRIEKIEKKVGAKDENL
jgi:hypothetical protein